MEAPQTVQCIENPQQKQKLDILSKLIFNVQLLYFIVLHHRGALAILDQCLFFFNKSSCACLSVIVPGIQYFIILNRRALVQYIGG